MTRAFLSLGSNMGDRLGYLRSAVTDLSDPAGPGKGRIAVTRVSDVFETEPVGGPIGQGCFYNLVVEVETSMTARLMLAVCQHLESRAGRVRVGNWGPRTLDVDILLFGEETFEEEDLVIPHPRMWERRFVVEPLAQIAPEVAAAAPVGTVLAGAVRSVGTL